MIFKQVWIIYTNCCCCSVTLLCPILCSLLDCSLPNSSVHGILQARILKWVAIPSPGDLPNPGIQPATSALETDSFPLSFLGSPNYMLCKPLFRYGTGLRTKESWALKNWCFWTVVLEKTLESPLDCKRSNQSVLKEISPEYSLEGLMLKLKLQFFGHLMQRTDSLKKTLMLGKTEGKRRRRRQRIRLVR